VKELEKLFSAERHLKRLNGDDDDDDDDDGDGGDDVDDDHDDLECISHLSTT